MRLEVVALDAVRESLEQNAKHHGALLNPLDAARQATATILAELAAALRSGRAPTPASSSPARRQLAAATEQLRAAVAATEGTAAGLPPDAYGRLLQAPDRLATLNGQLDNARMLAGTASRARAEAAPLTTPSLPPLRHVLAALRAVRANTTLGSATGRHATRLAILLPASELLGLVLPVARGYWVPLTILFVLQPDFRTTFVRGVARIAGTVAGVILATVLAGALPPQPVVTVLLVAVCAWGMYAFFLANYALFSVFVTALAVLLVDVLEPDALSDTLLARTLHTAVGGAIALLAYVLWPTWERQRLPEGLAASIAGVRRYAAAVLAGWVDPRAADPDALARAGDAARAARVDADASLDKAEHEPTAGAVDLEAARGVLAAVDHLLLALDVLSAHRQGEERSRPLRQLAPLARDLDAALRALASAARSGRPPRRLPALRRRMEALTGAGHDRDAAVVLGEAEAFVDGVDTLHRVLMAEARRTPRPRRRGNPQPPAARPGWRALVQPAVAPEAG